MNDGLYPNATSSRSSLSALSNDTFGSYVVVMFVLVSEMVVRVKEAAIVVKKPEIPQQSSNFGER